MGGGWIGGREACFACFACLLAFSAGLFLFLGFNWKGFDKRGEEKMMEECRKGGGRQKGTFNEW